MGAIGVKTGRWIPVLVGIISLTAGCGGNQASQAPEPIAESGAEPVAESGAEPGSVTVGQPPSGQPPELSEAPISSLRSVEDLPAVAVNRALPVPSLIPPTGAERRASGVNPGRTDPFEAIASSPIVQPRAVAAAPAVPVNPPPAPQPVAAAPAQVTTVPLPTLQPAPTDLSALPPVAIPAMPTPEAPASPTNIAETIEVSGIIQVGSQVNAIIQVPNEQTSRYVSVGDRLANGQVLVKRIEVDPNQDAVVIFEQAGVEVVRSVGSTLVSMR